MDPGRRRDGRGDDRPRSDEARTDPESIAITGTSAGANLADATVLRARDEGLPPPGAVALWSPSVDLTRDGDTWYTLDGLDPIIGLHMRLLSDTVRFHRALRRAGVDARLHVYEAMTHSAFFGGIPEEAEVGAEVRAFLHEHLRRGKEADDA
ncbi:alpha/beta hydrolase [Streptomyces sp. NPDC002920]